MSASLVGSEMCIRDSVRGVARDVSTAGAPARSVPIRLKGESSQFVEDLSLIHILTLPTICSV
eukprot:10959057-Alexandrium_andersonii.AAC.1